MHNEVKTPARRFELMEFPFPEVCASYQDAALNERSLCLLRVREVLRANPIGSLQKIVSATGLQGNSWMADCIPVLRQQAFMEFVAEEFRQAWGNDGSASSGGAWWADFR